MPGSDSFKFLFKHCIVNGSRLKLARLEYIMYSPLLLTEILFSSICCQLNITAVSIDTFNCAPQTIGKSIKINTYERIILSILSYIDVLFEKSGEVDKPFFILSSVMIKGSASDLSRPLFIISIIFFR